LLKVKEEKIEKELMLPKENRISKILFRLIYPRTKKINKSAFILAFSLSGEGRNRISFVVPKSVSKKSTIRNKLKRWGKSIFLNHQPGFKCCYVIIVIFKKEALALSYKKLEELFLEALKK